MADAQIVNLVPLVPDDRSLVDFERLPNGAELHEHFVAVAANANAQFLAVTLDAKRVGTAVFTFLPQEGALVCNALACDPIEGANIAVQVAELMEAWGLKIGASVLRFWTERNGLVKQMQKQGYQMKFVGEKSIG